MELQPQYDLSSKPISQPIFGKVFNGFVPDFWDRIKWDSDYEDHVLVIYSLNGIHWELASRLKTTLDEPWKDGYHLIVLNPDFRLEDVTDPIRTRTNQYSC